MGRIFMILGALVVMAGAGQAGSHRVAEDQTATGRFLTATEVRPILTATRANWIAVRDYDGQDLVYFTHLLSWRCGLFEVHYAINGGPVRAFPIPECPPDIASPNAIPEDAQIFLSFGAGSVQSIDVEILYDDLSTDQAHFERAQVLMP